MVGQLLGLPVMSYDCRGYDDGGDDRGGGDVNDQARAVTEVMSVKHQRWKRRIYLGGRGPSIVRSMGGVCVRMRGVRDRCRVMRHVGGGGGGFVNRGRCRGQTSKGTKQP